MWGGWWGRLVRFLVSVDLDGFGIYAGIGLGRGLGKVVGSLVM